MVAPTKFWKATKRAFAIQRGYGLLWPLSELSAAHGLRAVWVDLDNRHGLERQLRALEAWMGADGTHAAFGDMGLGSHGGGHKKARAGRAGLVLFELGITSVPCRQMCSPPVPA